MLKQRLLSLFAALALVGVFSVPALAEESTSAGEAPDESIVAIVEDDAAEGLEVSGEPSAEEPAPAEPAANEEPAPVEPAPAEIPIEESGTASGESSDLDVSAEKGNPEQDELDQRAAAAAGLVADDTYYISSILADEQVVDVSGQSKSDGGNLIVYKWNGGDNQKWELTHDSIGYVSLRSVLSGLLLSVDGDGEGANICQMSDLTGDEAKSQKWIIEQAAGGEGYTFISALSPNLVLDLTGCSYKNGTNVEVWTDNGGKNQAFNLYDATPEVGPSTATIAEGYYGIQASSTTNVLDVSGQSTKDGANVCTWSSNGGANQMFKVTAEGDFYRIAAAHSDKAVSMAENCPIPGVNVAQKGVETDDALSLFSAALNSDGSITFTNVATGLVLTSNGTAKGANIYGDASTGESSQQFQLFEIKNLLNEGMYEIVPNTNAKARLDVSGQSRKSGANITLWTDNDGQNQKWDIQLVPGLENTYTIQSVISGAYLAVEGTTEGSNVSQQALDPTDPAAQWVPSYTGGLITFENVASGLMLDVTGCGKKDGTNIEIWTENTSPAQRFSLSSTYPIKDGCFFIEFAIDEAQVVDVSGKSTKSGGNVISYANNKGANQKWYFQRQSDGTYKIVNAYSELPLSVAGSSASSGTNVQQSANSSSAAQRWNLVYNHDGTFSIVNALNPSVVLSVAGGTPGNSANVNVQSDAGDDGQRFVFEQTSYSGGSLGLTGAKLSMYKLAQTYGQTSNGWMIMIDNDECWVGIFRWYDGRWNYDRYFRCSNGKSSTPTVRGIFYTGAKGYTFGSDQGHACYWYTQIYDDYLFHSTLYQPYSFDHLDSRLGMHLSNGCVRLQIDNAKYIYDNVPYNTMIVSYN